jgi:hypothetical protein
MRPIIIIAIAALITGLVAIWNANGIVAGSRKVDFVASPSMDTVPKLIDTKNLPEQQYDAI